MRDPKVRLPADEARCIPSRDCGMQSHCARALAPIPQPYGSVMDAMATNLAFFGCHLYLSADRYRTAPAAEPRKVFPPLGTT